VTANRQFGCRTGSPATPCSTMQHTRRDPPPISTQEKKGSTNCASPPRVSRRLSRQFPATLPHPREPSKSVGWWRMKQNARWGEVVK